VQALSGTRSSPDQAGLSCKAASASIDLVLVGNFRLGHTDGVIRLRLVGRARALPS